jgi:hypothetical protein
LGILDNDSCVHNVLIGLGNNRNQEVNQHNKNQKLIGEPNSVNDVNGRGSGQCNALIFIRLMINPISS